MRRAALFAALWSVGFVCAQTPVSAPPQPPAPSTPAPAQEKLITFDPQHVELQWKNSRWQLTAGDVVLKDFAQRQADGRQAFRLVQELGLTQLGAIGTPKPVMEYWLAAGKPPRAPAGSVQFTPLDLANLRVDRVQDQWCVRDGARTLFNFGAHRDEAEQALTVLRKYNFTHLAQVGPTRPGVALLVSDPDGTAARAVAPPGSLASRTHQPSTPRPASGPGNGPGTSVQRPPNTGMQDLTTPRPLSASRPFGAAEPRSDQVTPAEVVPFDWRQVQMRRDGAQVKLTYGSYALGAFTNERDARIALNAIQHYRFNQHCLTGRPDPAFSWFLVNGRAPQGVMFGVDSTP